MKRIASSPVMVVPCLVLSFAWQCMPVTAQAGPQPQETRAASDTAYDGGSSTSIKGPLNKTTARSKNNSQERTTRQKLRKDNWAAYRMVRDIWFDRAAAAQPALVEAVCAHPGPARMLAKHRHIAQVAEADHYLCRRLTRWKGATAALIANPHCDRVIMLDPEGIYRAIKRNPKVARILAKHVMFSQMVGDNPDLGKLIAQHM